MREIMPRRWNRSWCLVTKVYLAVSGSGTAISNSSSSSQSLSTSLPNRLLEPFEPERSSRCTKVTLLSDSYMPHA